MFHVNIRVLVMYISDHLTADFSNFLCNMIEVTT